MSNRSVFEEVEAATPRAEPAQAAREPERRAISLWLWLLTALVVFMVLVGGATRLTDSGLSITEWAPVMGSVPPLSADDWDAAFLAYQQTDEFKQQNNWMTLSDFKPIYWWEWGHRMFGRVIGLVWAVGLVWFVARGVVPRGWTWRLILPGALGAVQGAVGWWMVVSGLSGRLDVAPYRLALHLGLAFLILSILVWLALRIRRDEVATLKARRSRIGHLMGISGLMIFLVFLQCLGGALVAGLDAGRGYVDWPLMEGAIFPVDALTMVPVWLNVFENPALAQFNHRVLGYLVAAVAIVFVMRASRTAHLRVRWLIRLSGLAILGQVVLGIITVMNAAPLGLALGHQALALTVVVLLVITRHEIAYPAPQSVRSG